MSANDPAEPSAPHLSRSISASRVEKRKPGRPRKDGRDDTPADVSIPVVRQKPDVDNLLTKHVHANSTYETQRRKVQLRLAQRKSRSKKELNLASKNTQIEHLQGTINAMNTSFLHLNKAVLDSGILQARPDLLAKFQETARSFVQLIHAIDRWDVSDPSAISSTFDTPSGISSISEDEPYSAPLSLRTSYFTFPPASSLATPAGPQALLSYITEPSPSSGLTQTPWSFAGDGVESFGRRLHYNTSYLAHWSLVGSDDLSRRIANIFFRLSTSGRKREDIAASLSRTLASIARVSDRIDLRAYQETAKDMLQRRKTNRRPSRAESTSAIPSTPELLSPYDTEIYLNDRGVRFFDNATRAIFTSTPSTYVPPSQRRRSRVSRVQPSSDEPFGSPPTVAGTSSQPFLAAEENSSDEDDDPLQSYILERTSSAPEYSNPLSRSSLHSQSLSITASPERDVGYFTSAQKQKGRAPTFDSRPLEELSGSEAAADISSALEEAEYDESAGFDPQLRLSPAWATSEQETAEEGMPFDQPDLQDIREERVDVECLLRNIAVRGICNGYSIGFPKRAIDEALAMCIISA